MQKSNTSSRFFCDIQTYTNPEISLCCHRYLTVIYCFRGVLNIEIDTVNIYVNENECCLILPNQAYQISSTQNAQCAICNYSPEYVPALYENYNNLYTADPIIRDKNTTKLITSLIDSQQDIYCSASVLCHIFSLFIRDKEFLPREHKFKSFINNTLQYVENNYNKSPSLIELSELLGYNSHYVSNILAKCFGKNFAQLINEYRTQKAIQYIKSGDYSITTISTLCGFESIRSFNRNFLRLTGLSPRAYKNKCNG